MRSLKSAYVLLALGALSFAGVVGGCSADGGTPIEDTDSGSQGTVDGSPEDTSTGGQDSTVSDSGHDTAPMPPVKDSSVKDTALPDTNMPDVVDAQVIEAGQDAGGPQGSPCSPLNQIQQQTCGLCGFQTRTCLVTDGGSQGVWGPWGFCQNEVVGGCVPGATLMEACGLCGMRQKICQNDCNYAVGSCQGQPQNACSPGALDFQVGLSCDAGGRERFCSDGGAGMPGVPACTWGNYGNCFVPDGGTTGASINIAGTAGAKVSGKFTIPTSQSIARLDALSSCPNATISSSVTNYQYVEVHNPTNKTATVSIWTSQATGGPYIDNILATYNGVNVPLTDPQRQACSVGVNDTCFDTSDPTSCKSSWAGLMIGDQSAVTIAPSGSVVVYNAAYFSAKSGDYMLSVRTETLQ